MISLSPAVRHSVIAAGFVIAALVLGGGGTPNPVTEIILQLLCVVAVLAWLWVPGEDGSPPLPRALGAWWLAALVLLLPVVQLLPLPAGLWSELPGQGDRQAALSLVGAADHWRPLSLSPLRTLASLLAIVPAALTLLATASLDARGRLWLIRAVAAVALVAAALGAVQLSLGEAAPRLYAQSNGGVTGFQANKNAAADVLLIGMAALAVVLAPASGSGRSARQTAPLLTDGAMVWLVLAGTLAVLLFATLFTNSRAGIALIPLALLGVWAILASAGGRLAGKWILPALVGVFAITGLGLFALVEGNTALGGIFARFAANDDFRRQLWRDGWFAMTQSWPSGIGIGGAEQALVAAERLEVVDPSAPNRVHNDYLEFVLEGGLPAIAVLIGSAGVCVVAAWHRWRTRPSARAQTAFGLTVLLVIALHSLVDYPLRSMAVACLAGIGAGLLFAAPHERPKSSRESAA